MLQWQCSAVQAHWYWDIPGRCPEMLKGYQGYIWQEPCYKLWHTVTYSVEVSNQGLVHAFWYIPLASLRCKSYFWKMARRYLIAANYFSWTFPISSLSFSLCKGILKHFWNQSFLVITAIIYGEATYLDSRGTNFISHLSQSTNDGLINCEDCILCFASITIPTGNKISSAPRPKVWPNQRPMFETILGPLLGLLVYQTTSNHGWKI